MSSSNPKGSSWTRWEPHIHTPGTARNDQFGGTTWEEYCAAIEAASPAIRALGVTDYLSIDGYEQVLKCKNAGLLPNVELVFPNVEIRFAVGTVQGSAVNAHLLFSPDDPDHVGQIRRFLGRLTFSHLGEEYCCTREDLVSLGRKHKPSLTDDTAAYREGVNQFKITFDDLRFALSKNGWASANCLIGVASGQGDGTSGLRTADSAFDALRTSIESFSHIIFSGNPKDREFWVGRGADSPDVIRARWGSIKPCLHGSDAHSVEKVGKPDKDRYCWIKGDLDFEALRQACIEPEGRVIVSPEPPSGSRTTQTIASVVVSSAGWMSPSDLPINPGLVAIIGARGSGKTALADLIAAGALTTSPYANDKSFVQRARGHLGGSMVTVNWQSGEETAHDLAQTPDTSPWELPRVQYLSQQFVDELCSSDGLADSLVREVQRVVFNAHPVDEREGASDFPELYELRCREALESRQRNEKALDGISTSLLAEYQTKQGATALKKQLVELDAQIGKDTKDRNALIKPGQEERAKAHAGVTALLQKRRGSLESKQKQVRSLTGLKADLDEFGSRVAPDYLVKLKALREGAALDEADWLRFLPLMPDGTFGWLDTRLTLARQEVDLIAGKERPPVSDDDLAKTLLPDNTDPSTITVGLLKAEADRLSRLIGIDNQNAAKFKGLNAKLETASRTRIRLEAQIKKAEGADARIKELNLERRECYKGVFESVEILGSELDRLYSPLLRSLEGADGALGKLGLVVRRHVDVDIWARQGEELLDLRREGPFRGKGALHQAITGMLLGPWQSGDAEAAATAMRDFMKEYEGAIRAHRLESMDSQEWNLSVGRWFRDTRHITVRYGIQYDGVDIEMLSPGTRGIVLLLLYLAVDQEDDRPLIIDQPEENLDPQSVFDNSSVDSGPRSPAGR